MGNRFISPICQSFIVFCDFGLSKMENKKIMDRGENPSKTQIYLHDFPKRHERKSQPDGVPHDME
jgi:hypothetical protein